MKLIAVGDNVADTYINTHIFYPGGNCVNVAVDAKKAGAKEVGYLGIFGDDVQAKHIKEALKEEDVSLVNCRQVYAPTAQPRVLLDEDGDRKFAPGPKRSSQHLFKLRLTPEDYEKIGQYNVLHTSVDSNIENDLEKLKSLVKISFDFSDCRNEEYLKRNLPHVDFAFFSGSDLDDYEVEKAAQRWFTAGPEVVVITRGSKPALVMNASEHYYQVPQTTMVVDTMGAGDSFIAGFLVAYMDTHSIEKAAKKASQNAADTCGLDGGFGHGKPF